MCIGVFEGGCVCAFTDWKQGQSMHAAPGANYGRRLDDARPHLDSIIQHGHMFETGTCVCAYLLIYYLLFKYTYRIVINFRNSIFSTASNLVLR